MNRFLLTALLLIPVTAAAQQQPPLSVPAASVKKPEMALIPREVISSVLTLANAYSALHPEFVTPTTQTAFSALDACLKDNPQKSEPDQCPSVTAAIEERTKEVADLQAKIAELQGKQDVAGKTVSVKP